MDDLWVDGLARRVVSGATTRRGWLRLVTTLPLVAVVVGRPASDATSRRRRRTHRDPGSDKDNKQRQRRAKRKGPPAAAGWPCSGSDRCAAGFECTKPDPDLLAGFCVPPSGAGCAVVTEACEPGGRPCCGDLECRMVPGGQAICVPPAKRVGARCSRATECQGGRCRKGRCRCVEGLVSCGGECVDLQTDPRHCGGCAATCGGNEFCFEGICSVGGGAGWGWGGTACAFPTDGGICLGWPLWRVAETPVSLYETARRGAVSCELFTRRYRCPLCAFGGDRAQCGAMEDPTPAQAERHCSPTESTIELVNCRESDCQPGETLCTHQCRPFDSLCPQQKGSIVPAIDVCTSRPDIYCGAALPGN